MRWMLCSNGGAALEENSRIDVMFSLVTSRELKWQDFIDFFPNLQFPFATVLHSPLRCGIG
jgi:hypothetical protein